MAIIRCPAGHFYDDGKNTECPMCKRMKEGKQESWTVSAWQLTSGRNAQETVMLGGNRAETADPERTIGIFSKARGNDPVTGWLVCVAGPERGRDYRLHHGYNNLGRSSGQDIYVSEDPEISREGHCSVVYDHTHSQFLLLPLKGNLVYRGEEAVEHPARIESGDRFKVGSSVFELVAFCREGHTWEEE